MTADMCWAPGSYRDWPYSPAGRTLARYPGDPSDVVTVAGEMYDIANAMVRASSTLQRVAESEDGQQGKAVDKLRELVGDTWEVLGEAGEMYRSTASAIRTYGSAMDRTIAEAINGAYTLAEQAWQAYQGLPGNRDGELVAPEPADDATPSEVSEAEGDAADNKAKYDAFQDWMNAANHWDAQYEDWENAWNAAIDAIETAHEHGPADGWGEFFDDLYEFLTVAGFVLAVLALVVTTGPLAPFIAAAAMVVGAATAIVAIVQYARGKIGLGTMLLDVACGLPLGPIAKGLSQIDLSVLGRVSESAASFVVPRIVIPDFAPGIANSVTSAAAPHAAALSNLANPLAMLDEAAAAYRALWGGYGTAGVVQDRLG